MAGNDNERTFVPAEIDALEDALEQAPTSVLSLPSTLDDDARARIHDVLVRYRAIERHAQALLVAEPPAALLADVIAQARAAVATPTVEPAPEPARPSLWSRLKALWIVPTLAGVGATALVLVMINRPAGDAAPTASEPPARVAANDRAAAAKAEAMPPLAQAEGRAKEEDDLRTARGQGVVDDVTATAKPAEQATELEEQLQTELRRSARDEAKKNKSATNDPAPAVDPFGEPSPRAEPKSTPPATKKPAKPASGAGGSSVPGGVPTPTPTTPSAGPKAPLPDNAEKDDTSAQERLTRADAARRRGDCTSARPDYDRVVETGTSKQRARARAGIALCLERSGDDAGARSLIDRARQDDAQIDAWVDAER